MACDIVLPRLMRVGGGASAQLPSLLGQLGGRFPLIVTDTEIVRLGYLKRITDVLERHGIPFGVFDGVVPDPTVASIDAGVAMFASNPAFDCVVGLGGGSPIDSAKAIALLASRGGRMRDYKVPTVSDDLDLPLVAIPTTAGTGSEATRFTVITDEETDEKMLCPGAAFCPAGALVDFELTMTMPARLTADTGIDTLTHAMEAYVSAKRNPFSSAMAEMAMRAISRDLRTVYTTPDDRAARESMMLAALYGGLAFSNASVCLVHGMSRPIGAFFHVPHGMSNAMLLPEVTAFSIDAAPDRYAECARIMGLAGPAESDEAACHSLLAELRALNDELAVPTPKAYGIDEFQYLEALPIMAEQALASGSPANNPRVPTKDEIVAIYRRIWDGGAA